jgi:hypothetical protein
MVLVMVMVLVVHAAAACDAEQDASLVFASCGDPNVFWPGIVEKAYAKLHGSYSSLQGGSVADALVDLTGGARPRYPRMKAQSPRTSQSSRSCRRRCCEVGHPGGGA